MVRKAGRKGRGLGKRLARWVVGLASVAAMVLLVGIFSCQEGNAVGGARPSAAEGGATATPPVAGGGFGSGGSSSETWVRTGEGWFDDDDRYEHDDHEWDDDLRWYGGYGGYDGGKGESGEEHIVQAIPGVGVPAAAGRRVFRTRAS
ncbi:hypothetical protein [Limnochorda pilosa]|uniref:Uncharacterized protein n=1 Tax=Limnochorda pilosa TaxID=1555112 RepID=A0A0K2SL84_LIMPI|nr:hypothetical protein [Limnochorda pilosa]BAS27757.1 hypothetical protein LIP_1916 [Limnochorda pilosa]